MARTISEVIGKRGLVMRPLILPLMCVVALAPQQAKCNDNVLVVENVDRVRVLNRYQQEATTADRKLLLSFAPMKILKPNETLGDGFTRCMQVEVEGEMFYLLKDSSGHLASTGSLGFEKTFSTTILPDTVQILTPDAVRLSPIRSAPLTLAKNALVVRIFRSSKLAYCRTVGLSSTFGWIDFATLKEGRSWTHLKRDSAPGISLYAFAQKIRERASEVNVVMNALFRFFNNQTHVQKPIPQWTILSSEGAILCTLEGRGMEDEFQQSTLYLSNEIENILLGSAFQVTHAPGRIEITPR